MSWYVPSTACWTSTLSQKTRTSTFLEILWGLTQQSTIHTWNQLISTPITCSSSHERVLTSTSLIHPYVHTVGTVFTCYNDRQTERLEDISLYFNLHSHANIWPYIYVEKTLPVPDQSIRCALRNLPPWKARSINKRGEGQQVLSVSFLQPRYCMSFSFSSDAWGCTPKVAVEGKGGAELWRLHGKRLEEHETSWILLPVNIHSRTVWLTVIQCSQQPHQSEVGRPRGPSWVLNSWRLHSMAAQERQ